MFDAWIIGGLSLGIVSSLHCIGMCGPLAMALPIHHLSMAKRVWALSCFHFGRLFTYATLGLLAGVAGKGLYISGWQQILTLTLGIIILAGFIAFYVLKTSIQPQWMSKAFQYLQQVMLKLLRSEKSSISYMLLGMANGLLPCGMVYVALAAAATLGHIDQSSLFMVLFGLGTLPTLLLFTLAGQFISFKFRLQLRKAIPFFIAFTGVLLILRGLDLNIPYLSPKLQSIGEEVLHCGISR